MQYDRKQPRRCTKIFKLDPAFHTRYRANTKKLMEFGTNTLIDFDRLLILPAEETTGGYNNINLIRGIVDCHTHPQPCLNDNSCALGLGSPSDIVNIVLGALSGTQCHILFSAEGTYLLSVPEAICSSLRESKDNIKKFCHSIRSNLETLHQQYVHSRTRYQNYQKTWMNLVRQFGFIVKFFPKDKPPRIPINFDCSLHGIHFFPVHVDPALQRLVETNFHSSNKRKTKSKSKRKYNRKSK